MALGFCLEQLIWGRQQENMIGGKITFPQPSLLDIQVQMSGKQVACMSLECRREVCLELYIQEVLTQMLFKATSLHESNKGENVMTEEKTIKSFSLGCSKVNKLAEEAEKDQPVRSRENGFLEVHPGRNSIQEKGRVNWSDVAHESKNIRIKN